MRKNNVENAVLEFLKKNTDGGMTKWDAFHLGSTDLCGVIRNLRNKGYLIDTVMEDGVNKYGAKVLYGRYFLRGVTNE